jgi:hypothetical protein
MSVDGYASLFLSPSVDERTVLMSMLVCFLSTMAGQIIKKLIERKQSQIRKVYPGLTCFKEGVRQIPVESIPGISKWLWVLLIPCSGYRLLMPCPMSCFNYSLSLGETGWKPSAKEKV